MWSGGQNRRLACKVTKRVRGYKKAGAKHVNLSAVTRHLRECLTHSSKRLDLHRYRYWIAPIGKAIGIKSTGPKPPRPNKILEAAYNVNSRLSHKTPGRRIGDWSVSHKPCGASQSKLVAYRWIETTHFLMGRECVVAVAILGTMSAWTARTENCETNG
uniref:AGAP001761-PA n=1 Tax=Anopheles stephensi TaxID=30069 RepID=H6WAR1_ANOST|nr:AGAP001761-PA [Anopheles stephensi]